MHINFEFKARHQNIQELENKLKQHYNPVFAGEDHQTDTYFNVPNGRLKLREGNIEHALIHYQRSDTTEAKQSDVILYKPSPDNALKEVLTAALGIKTMVDKRRRIYFVENVKFHFDEVKDLGTFIEVEAIDKDGSIGIDLLKQQCAQYRNFFGLDDQNLLSDSYSDMVMAKNTQNTI